MSSDRANVPESEPRIVYPLLVPDAAIAAIMIVDGLILARNHWVGAAYAVGGLFFGLRFVRDLSTRVTAVGVTQLTWRGRRRLNWADVTGVVRKPRSVLVSGNAGSIVLPIESFSDSNETLRFIHERLPPELGVTADAANS